MSGISNAQGRQTTLCLPMLMDVKQRMLQGSLQPGGVSTDASQCCECASAARDGEAEACLAGPEID